MRDERGTVMVIAAMLIPVLLVLTALIYDGGTWFTHKRQLQNRADAGALAAGYQMGLDWPACGGDAATKLAAETRIDDAARQYAGDPQEAGTLHNTEITDQNRVNVEINSKAAHVDSDTSWNDPAGDGIGPCDPQTTTDRYSPILGANYVDVGVRERDQQTLFGMFGLDLLRNTAHARVEMKTVAAGKGFLPLALPDQIISQAEIRYYRYCPDPNNPVQMGLPITLQPLSDGSNGTDDYQTVAGSSLWAPTMGNQKNGTPTGVTLTLPDEKTCGAAFNYIPIRAEVRVAGVDKSVIDIDNNAYNGPAGCTALANQRYADCWSQLSEIRLDKDDPRTEPWLHELKLTTGGSGQCSPDAYFARVSGATTSCSYGVSIRVKWNGLATSPPDGRQLELKVAGAAMTGTGDGVWTGSASNNALGQSTIQAEWRCTDQDPKFPGNPSKRIACPGTSGNWTPVTVRSLFLGNRANSGLVTLVRTSQNPQGIGGGPGAPIDWYPAPQGGTQDITIYPTVGLESALYVGQHRVLRAPHCKNGTNSDNCDLDTSSPGDSQSIDCEPGGGTGGQGHDFGMFLNGCRPWYFDNSFADPNWWPCPNSLSYNIADPSASTPPNGPGSPWHCVVKAPGFSPNVIADGIAARIGNCPPKNIKSNNCNGYQCINPNYYDPTNPDEWTLQGGEASPRVIYIFVVPYGAYKNTGSQDTIPLLTFAAFYVTGWSGSGGSGKNPCEDSKNLPPNPDPTGPAPIVDEDTSGGDIAGYFVGYTMPDAPGDPHSICAHDQLKPCTPVLVR